MRLVARQDCIDLKTALVVYHEFVVFCLSIKTAPDPTRASRVMGREPCRLR